MPITNKLFLTALLALSLASTAFADAPAPQTEIYIPSAADRAAQKAADQETYGLKAKSIGLTVDEFIARDNILSKTLFSLPYGLNERLKDDPLYADSWVQYQPKPQLVFTFAGLEGYKRGKALMSLYATEFGGFWVNYVEVREAAISRIELNKLRDDVQAALNAHGIRNNTGTTADIKNSFSHVIVETMLPVKTVEEQLLKAGIKPSLFIKIIQIPAFAVPYSSLYGGFGLAPTLTGQPLCTSGFTVQNAAGTRGVLTAAHCPDTLYTQGDGTVNKLLTFNGQQYGGAYDVQWNTAPATSFTMSNRILGEALPVTGSYPTALLKLGYWVCKRGMVTGRTCGDITMLNDTHPAFPSGTQTYVRVTCDPGTINCAMGGDSGSPVYKTFGYGLNNLAYGVMVGGANELNYFTYMPIDYISALGVSLLTSP